MDLPDKGTAPTMAGVTVAAAGSFRPAPRDLTSPGRASKRLSCEVIQGYEMTELSPVSHLTPPGWFKPGSVGVTAPDTQTRIADPVTWADLGTGEEGEVWVRGPQVMAGYLNNPQATAATIDPDGWLHTGDLPPT